MYTVDRKSGHLTLLSDTKSPREHDGPRHVVVSLDGGILYSVTEHSESQYFLRLILVVYQSYYTRSQLCRRLQRHRDILSTSSRSLFFHLNRILLTTAATLSASDLLLRSLHPQLTYLRLLEAPTPHTKGSSPYSPSCQLDYSAPTNRNPRDGRPLPRAVKRTLSN